ncbi:MFS transporter [Mesorhizobium kowhaii]|nr:MFS transporter [Mesorhizobium kowhaii]
MTTQSSISHGDAIMMTEAARPTVRYQWMLAGLLSLNFGVVFFDRNALSFLMPFIKPELQLSNTEVGAFTSALSLSWALSCLLVGRVSDALGKRKLILVMCTLCFSCTSFLSGLAGSFFALLAARLLMGVAEGGVMPISQALIVQEVDPLRRGLAMGVMQNFGSNLLGNFFAPLILVAVSLSFGWRNAFFLAGLPGLVMAGLLILLVKDPPSAPSNGRKTRKTGALLEMLSDRNVLLCMMMSVFLVGFIMVFGAFMPLVLLSDQTIDQTTMSWLMATFGLASMLYSVLVPGGSDVAGRKPVIVAMAALGALLPLGVLFADGTLWHLFVLFALGAVITGVFPIVMATVPSESVSPLHLATVLGLAMGVGEFIGGVFTPMIAGAAADSFGLTAALWILVALSLLVASCGLFLRETAPAVLARRVGDHKKLSID